MGLVTSALANKIIRNLEEEKKSLIVKEDKSSTYIVSDKEKEKFTPPEYSYKETQEKIDKIDETIMNIKHEINVFNTTTVLEDVGLTIDKALVKMAQLNNKKNKLSRMKSRLNKERVESYRQYSTDIEYEYANYNIEEVEKEFNEVVAEINKIQIALDTCNQVKTFEIVYS